MTHSTTAFGSLASSVSEVFTGLLSTLFGMLNMVIALGRDLFAGAFHIITGALQGILAVVTHVFGAAIDVVSGLVKAVIDIVGGVVGFVAANIVVISVAGLAYYLYTQRFNASSSPRKTQ